MKESYVGGCEKQITLSVVYFLHKSFVPVCCNSRPSRDWVVVLSGIYIYYIYLMWMFKVITPKEQLPAAWNQSPL